MRQKFLCNCGYSSVSTNRQIIYFEKQNSWMMNDVSNQLKAGRTTGDVNTSLQLLEIEPLQRKVDWRTI